MRRNIPFGLTLLVLSLSAHAQSPTPTPESPNFANQVQSIPEVTEPVSKQDGAQGFFADDSLSLLTRNFWARETGDRDTYYRIQKDYGVEQTRRRYAWVQGTQLKYSSGYTQGALGFGIDLALFNAINLERGHGRIAGGGNRTLANGEGDALDSWSKLGVADVRLRLSNTELKAGRFLVDTPVFNYIDNRPLPSSFEGLGLVSEEWQNLALQAGSFDRVSPRTGAGDEPFTTEYGDRTAEADRMSYLGGTYTPTSSLAFSLYGARFEDIWDQVYFSASHTAGDATSLSLQTQLNYYHTQDQGAQKAGYIDNDAYSLSFTATHQAHGLTLGLQQIEGDEYFDYVHETSAIYLANSLFSDYNGPNEKSVQLRYGTDWGQLGVPGLTTSLWWARGWNVDGTHYDGGRNGRHANYADVLIQDDEHHYETGLLTAYKVQSGPIKDALFKATYIVHRASENQSDGNLSEVRITSTFPFELL
ncbi:MAG: OprD family outer membrane porin [Pseudomonas sp.]|uniref:OprD family outer membrane porin n=1 Tax=Pseudomonas sp. TaxID=306 RepID=UPI003393C1EB